MLISNIWCNSVEVKAWQWISLITDLVVMQIAEDMPEILDSEIPGLADRPIAIFIPRLLQVWVKVFVFLLFQYVLCLVLTLALAGLHLTNNLDH